MSRYAKMITKDKMSQLVTIPLLQISHPKSWGREEGRFYRVIVTPTSPVQSLLFRQRDGEDKGGAE